MLRRRGSSLLTSLSVMNMIEQLSLLISHSREGGNSKDGEDLVSTP